ncbi:MAG TPA: S8 family serine peptidase [Pyrinomonadaceae bacterium]|nr:S8 family serine peptidase [Pyrinomonadaceae bacterium]
MNIRKSLSLFTSLALLLAALAGASSGSRVLAQTGTGGGSAQIDKVGADLRKKIKDSQSGERVDVIVQSNTVWNAQLDSAVQGNGGTVKRAFKNVNARVVNLSPSSVENLARRSDVRYVSLDRGVRTLGHLSLTTGTDAARAMGGATAYAGTGLGIAVLDSGIDPRHVSYDDATNRTRIVYRQDFTGERDASGQPVTDDIYGHGSHVAAIAAGTGGVAQGAYQGIAPNARLVNLRVLDSQGKGTVSGVLGALDWVMTNRANPAYNIRVVNMSLGTAAIDSYRNDPLCLAVRRLVDEGVVVVAAAGNEGRDSAGNKIYGQIHSPGNEPSAITVGASNTYGTDARDDDGVTSYSSRGPTRSFSTDSSGVRHYDNLVKPDLVAPGNRIIAAQAPENFLVTNNPSLDANVATNALKEQMYLSGTSMATPVVAGAAALLLQANPKLTPNMVKMILMYTAQPLRGFNNFEHGAGQVNLEGAMRLARLVRTDLSSSTPVGAPLLTSPAPAPETTIAGHTFQWGGGVIMDHTFATGTSLITQYQKIYDLGVLLQDGAVESNGITLSEGTLMSDGVMMSDNILRSTGVTLSEGTIFCANGVMMNDGAMLGDGTLMSYSMLMGNSVLMSDVSAQASNALVYGDNTAAMPLQLDGEPGGLTALAVSNSRIDLKWVDNSGNEGGFRVERSTDGTTFVQIATVSANSNCYTNTGLLAGKKYFYRVYAYNGTGKTARSNTASVTTLRK